MFGILIAMRSYVKLIARTRKRNTIQLMGIVLTYSIYYIYLFTICIYIYIYIYIYICIYLIAIALSQKNKMK